MYKFKVDQRVRLTVDVEPVGPGRTLTRGETGTIWGEHRQGDDELYRVLFDCGYAAWIAVAQMALVPTEGAEIALLRAQLAARDAALDAVLALVRNLEASKKPATQALAAILAELLLKHGVHPK